MAEPRGGTRPYASPLREQRAAQTRAAILAAARDLFEADGFGSSTVAAIAGQAGVSVQTIYSTFGGKPGLVRAVVEQMEESAEAAAWRAKIDAAEEPGLIVEAFARWTAAFFAASKPTMRIAAGAVAAAGAPGAATAAGELADLVDEGNAHRRAALTSLVERLAAMSALREDLTAARAVDRMWLLTGVETFQSATVGCGWSEDDYAGWLTETLIGQVLHPV